MTPDVMHRRWFVNSAAALTAGAVVTLAAVAFLPWSLAWQLGAATATTVLIYAVQSWLRARRAAADAGWLR